MFPTSQFQMSDEEYVEKIWKSVLFWDRFRFWAMPVQLAMLAAFIWFCIWALKTLHQAMAGPGPPGMQQGMWDGFSVGAVVGVTLGLMFGKIMHALANLLRPGLRTERLLLVYHDRLFGTDGGDDQVQSSDRDVLRRGSSGTLE